jgi:hypothetical protein
MQLTICDHLIPERLWRAASADWPGDDWSGWHAYADGKRASRSVETAPRSIRLCLEFLALRSPLFAAEAFPDLSFYGAGLHELPAGVGLDWHRDAARHPLRPWRRAATSLLYLDDGGELIFRGDPELRAAPRPGRVATFAGAAEHCVAPSSCRRRSLAVFFYVLDPTAGGSGQAEFRHAQDD